MCADDLQITGIRLRLRKNKKRTVSGESRSAAARSNPYLVENFPITGVSGKAPERGDLREVKRIRLVGYTVALRNHYLLQAELLNKLADSKFFAAEWTMGDNRTSGNLTSFEVFLQLKEPIRK